jgi:hypothetical protein
MDNEMMKASCIRIGKYPKLIHLTIIASIGVAIRVYIDARRIGILYRDIESRIPIVDTPMARNTIAETTRAFGSETENTAWAVLIAHDGELSGLGSGSKQSPSSHTTSAKLHI